MSRKQWRCFYCDAVFYSAKTAAIHFGEDGATTPACKLSSVEGHLVDYIRRLEAEIESNRREDHEMMLAAMAMDSESRAAARIAEEKGYDRGVAETWAMARQEAAKALESTDKAESAVSQKPAESEEVVKSPSEIRRQAADAEIRSQVKRIPSNNTEEVEGGR